MLMQLQFWLSLVKITWIDFLLSGDNALVIAIVCRGLPGRQRFWAMALGAGGALILRIICTGTVAVVMGIPYLKLVGGIFLLYIAVKLLKPTVDDDPDHKEAHSLWHAIGVVILADITMSMDNVIAIVAAAHGNLVLISLGLAMSIPLIVIGASIIAAMLDRLPILLWAGAALLGWIAGEVIVDDRIIAPLLHLQPTMYAAFAACLVVIVGGFLKLQSRWRIS